VGVFETEEKYAGRLGVEALEKAIKN